MSDAVKAQRNQMVQQAVDRIRAIEKDRGVTHEALEEIKTVMLELASHKDLFPEEDFPPQADANGAFPIYRLAEDDDRRFAMYMSTSIGVKDVPPHNHTTWAVIAGVQGEEENRFYQRVGNDSEPGKGRIQQVGGETVRPGIAVGLMPDDIHSIHPRNERPGLHLHMYGRSLEDLPNRTTFNMEAGTYRVFPANPNIQEAR